MHELAWELVREIGVQREGSSAGADLLPRPVAIERIGGLREFLVLARRGNRGSLFMLSNSVLWPLSLQGLRCDSGMIKSISWLSAKDFLVVAGDYPREISFLEGVGHVRRCFWSSNCPGPLNWPSCAIPFHHGQFLVGDQARHTSSSYIPAGLCLLSASGDCLWQWRPGKDRNGLGEPTHLLLTPDGGIVVTDCELHRVMCVTAPGRIRWVYGEIGLPGAEPGHLSCPTSTTLTPRGTLLGRRHT